MKYVLHVYVSTYRIMCEVPNMAAFCGSLTLRLPGMLLRNPLDDFLMVLVIPVITGSTFVFYIPHVLNFYIKCFTFYNLLAFIIIIIIIIIAME